MTHVAPYKSDWPYGTKSNRPTRGDVIPVVMNGRKVFAAVSFWNRFGIWLRSRNDDTVLFLSLRAIEYNYARHW
jgi:hypothetical protein